MAALKLLVIDDNPQYSEALAKYMQETGTFGPVIAIQDGNRALECFKAELPDVLILDMIMPDCDGLDLLRQLKSVDTGGRRVYFFACSPMLSEAVMTLACGLGIDYYFAMPKGMDLIYERMTEIIRAGGVKMESAPVKRYSRDMSREEIIVNYLRALGVAPNLSGYTYLRLCIDYWVENSGRRLELTTNVYPAVAPLARTNPKCMERNIRTAIEKAWDRASDQNIRAQHTIFGYTVNDLKGRPTNKEFIAMIADRTIMRLKQERNK